MPAASYDFTIEQGTTWKRTIRLTRQGVAVDLTNDTFAAQIRKTHNGPMLVEIKCDVLSPLEGTLVLSLTPAQTSSLPAGESIDDPKSQYVYDVEWTVNAGLADEEVKRILDGAIIVSPEVTKPVPQT